MGILGIFNVSNCNCSGLFKEKAKKLASETEAEGVAKVRLSLRKPKRLASETEVEFGGTYEQA